MRKRLLVLLTACLLSGSVLAGEGHGPSHGSKAVCGEPALRCATTATPTFGPDGRLWLAWAAGGQVLVASSTDRGASFGPPVQVTEDPAVIDDGGEARPRIAVLPDGVLVVVWSVRHEQAYDGTAMVARSANGGMSFSKPMPLVIEEKPTSQRFVSLLVASTGRLYAVWIDKRAVKAATAIGSPYAGAALALAWSDDSGGSFAHGRILADHSCECCRVAMALGRDDVPVLLWRHIFPPNLRDHAVMRVPTSGVGGAEASPLRVAVDDWSTDACPHHGPSLAVDAAGTWHAAWYTAGKRRQGLFVAHSGDGGRSFSSPLEFGDPKQAPSHPFLLAAKGRLWLVWKEISSVGVDIRRMVSADGARTWSAPGTVATTTQASDHPLLISDGTSVFLSWMTRAEGYRLIPLGEER
ncbi:MAG: sialidase family protein [Alphaproteobacteria bacterium]